MTEQDQTSEEIPPVEPAETESDSGPALDFNFVPSWAKEDPSARVVSDRPGRMGPPRHDRRERGEWGGRDRDRRPPRRPGDDRRGPRDRDRRDQGRPPPAPARPYDRGGGGADHERGPVRRGHGFRPAPVFLPEARVSLVPEQKHVAGMFRRIKLSKMTYPVAGLARRMLVSPEGYQVKIEVADNHAPFFQCRICRMVVRGKNDMAAHVAEAHFDDFFLKETVTTEPPTGAFVCVARCGFSGILLGPPNHHSYNEKVREVHLAKFAHMPIEAYRNRIDVVHDAALVEKWKEESRTQTVYRLKGGDAAAPAMKWAEAEAHMMEKIVPDQVREVRRAILSGEGAKKIIDTPLREMIHGVWEREGRFPRMFMYALRAALRRMGLQTFRIGGTIECITSVRPSPLNTDHVVEPIREVLLYLKDHPGCTRAQLIEGLRPGLAPGSPEADKVIAPFSWLIEKGHIIEFFDGTLSVPLAPTRARPPDAKPTGPQ